MIDPLNITKYDCSDAELDEQIVFWIMVAGKKAKPTAKRVETLRLNLQKFYRVRTGCIVPESIITLLSLYIRCAMVSYPATFHLADTLKKLGFGQYNQKASYLIDLVNSGVNLRTCSVDDLVAIKGVGPKTARCFVLHTRQGARVAGLDTHILRYLRQHTDVVNVPKATPTGKQYDRLEAIILGIADIKGLSAAAFDLQVWTHYSSGGELP